jgi:hypothetical protein
VTDQILLFSRINHKMEVKLATVSRINHKMEVKLATVTAVTVHKLQATTYEK